MLSSFVRESSAYNLQSKSSAAVLESMDKAEQRRKSILEQRQAYSQRERELTAFTSASKNFLLAEAMYDLFKKSIPSTVNESLTNLGRSVIDSFVNEEGASNLFAHCENTIYLNQLTSLVEATHKKVIKDCDGKNGPFKITNSDMKVFHDGLNKLDTEGITKEISKRVASAEEEFIKANLKDKENMEKLAQKTQEKLAKVQAKDVETESAIKNNMKALYKEQIENVERRQKGILESMIVRLSKSVVTEDASREQFTKEDGKLNMQGIIETAEIMYTVLEMVNTIQIKKITPNYIKETLMSIK